MERWCWKSVGKNKTGIINLVHYSSNQIYIIIFYYVSERDLQSPTGIVKLVKDSVLLQVLV